ncbi:MAG TPA: pyridoxal-phosphate dependent enzyme [Candidatus Saccharimonadales bacterium]|nr:pyridoxal-phosphate dependent enzyme [Candidatus Saccharimonadales bacterium]
MIYNSIEQVIGNTPLLKLDGKRYGLKNTDLYVKLEYLNPFGSIKDRTALGLLKDTKWKELERQNQHIIESSSGNTAKSLQVLASRHGVPVICVTNRIKVPEVEQQLRYLGTEIMSLPGRSECPDPNDENNTVAVIESMQHQQPNHYYHTAQYTNLANPLMHETTTAKELYEDLPTIDYMISGIGTGGSSSGLIAYASHHHLDTNHIGVVADPSDFLPGIRTKNELFETGLFEADAFLDIIEVTSADALKALQILVKNEGVLAGPTTGGNFAAATRYLLEHDTFREDGSRQTAVFIACDRLETYMSYIAKRQPELFDSTRLTDIFTAAVSDEEAKELSRAASHETQQWIVDENVLVVDTRGVKPFVNFHIEGSLNYPEDLLKEVLENGTPFADRPVLLVCPTGDRSKLLASVLSKRGVKAYSLGGGLLAWRSAGLPLVRKAL